MGNTAWKAFDVTITAIDPGTTESGIIHWQGEKPYGFGKFKNEDILDELREPDINGNELVIEEINPYTMGKSTRDTILWSGRFQEAWESKGRTVHYIPRTKVRQILCGNGGPKITDSVITQALVDRFAYGQNNFGKGTKKKPGFFYGFKKDVWQAFALAVAYVDIISEDTP
jgi:hypothetical protein